MRLKTYRAPDLPTALARAHDELGPGALVLATRECRGRLGLAAVEITVAGDDPGRPASPAAEPGARRASAPDAAAARRDETPWPARPSAGQTRSTGSSASSAEEPAELRVAVRALVAQGLDRDLAQRFARIAGRELRDRARTLSAASAGALGQILPLAELSLAPGVLFVVGPPGAGKTTTAAKLAARAVADGVERVVLAQADAERVGALEQAGTYCRSLGIDSTPVDGPEALQRVVAEAGGRALVLVDTFGAGARDGERLAELGRLRHRLPAARAALLVPAGLHREEVARIVRRFAPARPTCVAFSRVDDGSRPGELVSGVAPTGLPLAFITTGHRIPGDLEPATPAALARLLLGDGAPGGAAHGTDHDMEVSR